MNTIPIKGTQVTHTQVTIDVSYEEIFKHIVRAVCHSHKDWKAGYFIRKGKVCYDEYSHHNGDPYDVEVRTATEEDIRVFEYINETLKYLKKMVGSK